MTVASKVDLSVSLDVSLDVTLSAVERFVRMFAGSGASLFTGHRYALNEPAGTVAALVDWFDSSHLLAQPGSASLQVAAPKSDTLFGGQPYLSFTGAQYYDSSRPASAWKFLHFPGTTGCYALTIYVPRLTASTRALWATYRQPDHATSVGAVLFTNTSGNNFGYNVARNNATRTIAVNSTLAGTAVVRGVSVEYAETGVSPEYRTKNNGSDIATGVSSAAPLDADPSATLRLGAMAVIAESFTVADVALLFVLPRLPTTDERAVIQDVLSAYQVV